MEAGHLGKGHGQYSPPKPDQQGKFDGLCGIYAILNSIKWLYRIDEDDLDAMFQSLCVPQALWNGLGVPEIRRLLDTSASYLAEQHGYDDFHWHLPFLRRPFSTVNSFWRCVGEQISAHVPAVVIIGLNTPWDHWTVAHKVTPRAVAFFDSYDMGRYHFTSFTSRRPARPENHDRRGPVVSPQSRRMSFSGRARWTAPPTTCQCRHEDLRRGSATTLEDFQAK
jgi:hypothetical protein